MKHPHDKLLIQLSPVDTNSPLSPEDQVRALEAARAAVEAIANEKGVEVVESGELDPASERNQEREALIATAAAPRLARVASDPVDPSDFNIDIKGPDISLESLSWSFTKGLKVRGFRWKTGTAKISGSLDLLANIWNGPAEIIAKAESVCIAIRTAYRALKPGSSSKDSG